MQTRHPGMMEGRLVRRGPHCGRSAAREPEAMAVVSRRLTELYGPPLSYGRRDEVHINWHHPFAWPFRIVRDIGRPVIALLRAADAGGQRLIGGAAYDLRRAKKSAAKDQL